MITGMTIDFGFEPKNYTVKERTDIPNRSLEYALQKHNIDDAMAEFYKACGFEISWDFDKHLHWDELYLDNDLIFQGEQNITKKEFLKAMKGLFKDKDYDIPFFLASNINRKDLKKIIKKHFL